MENITLREQIDIYYQKLLILQFKASEDISHNPTKGSMREEFIKGLIEGCFPEIKLGKGLLSKGNWQSTQIDFMQLNSNARMDIIGGQNIVDIKDCCMVMEIKSNARSKEIEDFNEVARQIKNQSNNIIKCGMFCYNIDLKQETVLKRFGFKYEKPPLDYYIYGNSEILYQNIDFIFTLEAKNENEAYLVIKNIDNTYQNFMKNPIITYFINLFKNYL